MVLLDPSHSASLLSSADAAFFTSGAICMALCSAPMVAAVFLSLAHCLALFAEQSLYALSAHRYEIYIRGLFGSLRLLVLKFFAGQNISKTFFLNFIISVLDLQISLP